MKVTYKIHKIHSLSSHLKFNFSRQLPTKINDKANVTSISSTSIRRGKNLSNQNNEIIHKRKYIQEIALKTKSKNQFSWNKLIDKNIKIQEKNYRALSFKQFNLNKNILSVLEKNEIHAPTSIQNEVIPTLLDFKINNTFFCSNTGMGKTLTYLIPLIDNLKREEEKVKRSKSKRPRCLIIVPSRELAIQTEEVAKKFIYDCPLKIKSIYVSKYFNDEKAFLRDEIDILISTPERLKNHIQKGNVFTSNLSYLIIDELDTLLDSGHNVFLKTLISQQLVKIVKSSIEENIISKITLVSTTLTNSIDGWLNETFSENNKNFLELLEKTLINKYLRYEQNQIESDIDSPGNKITYKKLMEKLPNLIIKSTSLVKKIDKSTNHNLSNVLHNFIHITEYDKYPSLLKLLKEKYENNNQLSQNERKMLRENKASIIIFCNSIQCVRAVQFYLESNGFHSSALHGDIPPFKRNTELYNFKLKRKKILVCTDIIARGLDFDFVYYVINFDFPISLSDYIHRAGRTGRNGREGICYSFYRKKNLPLIEEIEACSKGEKSLDVGKSIFSMKNKETFDDKIKTKIKAQNNNSDKSKIEVQRNI